MNMYLTKSRRMGCLLLLAAGSLGILNASFARYAAQISGEGTAIVAAWGSDTELNLDVSELAPGQSKVFEFQITNQEGSQISHTGQNYSVAVNTTGNLPLEYSLFLVSGSPAEKGSFITDSKGTALTLTEGQAWAEGGFLPHSEAVSHVYRLEVSWPAAEETGTGSAIAEYADEIDLVTLTVSAEQAMPKESGSLGGSSDGE
jgi:hypothetical protein